MTKSFPVALGAAAVLTWGNSIGQAAVNPYVPFYGSGGTITATPQYPIVGENTHIAVTVGNTGDQPATNVRVKISFNDWGVTFMGWQEIATVVIPSIPAGGTATAQADYVFSHRTHTCLEALIVGADQDDDVNDDRGQINLEVINAGETFTYDVPIRNNGDQPLNLLLQGHCQGDAAGAPKRECPKLPQQVEVPPGQEILVPIQVDLRGFAIGQPLVFVVDAFNLGAADPFAPKNHNHVELHLIRQTARNLKTEALAAVVEVRDQASNKSLRNRLDAIVNHVALSLNPKWWLDDDHLRKAGGPSVFAQEKAAVEKILDLLKLNLGLPAKVTLNAAVLKLTDADRILAQTATQEAPLDPESAQEIQKGDQLRIRGDYKEAIEKYRDAWHDALDL